MHQKNLCQREELWLLFGRSVVLKNVCRVWWALLSFRGLRNTSAPMSSLSSSDMNLTRYWPFSLPSGMYTIRWSFSSGHWSGPGVNYSVMEALNVVSISKFSPANASVAAQEIIYCSQSESTEDWTGWIDMSIRADISSLRLPSYLAWRLDSPSTISA